MPKVTPIPPSTSISHNGYTIGTISHFDTKDSETLMYSRELKMLELCNIRFVGNIRRIKYGSNMLFRKNYWSILQKAKKHFIFTGSLSLKVFGLLDREIGDLDFIWQDNSKKNTTKWSSSGSNHKNYRVDYFDSYDNLRVIQIGDMLFQNPLQVLAKKIEFINHSDGKSYRYDFGDLSSYRKKNIDDLELAVQRLKQIQQDYYA